MVKSTPQRNSKRLRREEEEDDEIGECELVMCCAAGIVLLLAGAIVAIAVGPTHRHKIPPRTQFPSNVKTKTSFEVRPLSSASVKNALLSEEALESQIIDCTPFEKGGQSMSAVDLLVLVHSEPNPTSEIRNKVRQSWKRSTLPGVEVVFVVPAHGQSHAITELRRECKNYNDMIVFLNGPRVPESEFLLLQLAWASRRHVNFQYMLKTRDFMYVNLPRMMTDLIPELKRNHSNSYLGYFRADLKIRNKGFNMHPEPNWVLCDKYIRFAHSSGYILSRELVHRLHSQATYLYPYNNEGISVATWLSPYKDVDWLHDIRFNTEIGRSRGCRNNWLVSQSKNLALQHQNLQESGRSCTMEWEEVRTYSFNFETPPSNCCTPVVFK